MNLLSPILTMLQQPVKEKKNSEFKLIELHLKALSTARGGECIDNTPEND